MPKRVVTWLGATGVLLCFAGAVLGLIACVGSATREPFERMRWGGCAGMLAFVGVIVLGTVRPERTWLGRVGLIVRTVGALYLAAGATTRLLMDPHSLPEWYFLEGLEVYLGGEVLRILDQGLRLRARPPRPSRPPFPPEPYESAF